jgi:hypothetical protein
MTIEADIRTPLQTALSTIAANVYNGIPETMTSPSICLIPGAPYLESLPSGYVVGNVNQPQPLEVGAGKYLTLPIYKSAPTTPTKEKSCQQQSSPAET